MTEEENVPHRFVYRRTQQLLAGRRHQYRITNLRNLYPFQGAAADPVMHIVDPNGTILAENDDFNGLASQIIFTPATNTAATLIIRPFTTKTPGACVLEKGLDGNPPTPVDTNVSFNGLTGSVQFNAGDVFSTAFSTGDPMLFLRTGNVMLIDDDGADPIFGKLNAKIVAPTGGRGTLIVGSSSLTSEGACNLYLEPAAGPISIRLDMSERRDKFGRRPQDEPKGSPQMERYIAKLRESKEMLEALEPSEREQKVIELQEQFLTEDERRPLILPAPQAAADFVTLQRLYLERYREIERELEGLPYEERAARVSALKTHIMGSP